MSTKSKIADDIHQKEKRLNRFLNDSWIFVRDLRPSLETRATELRKSKSKTKHEYEVPRHGKPVVSTRRDSEIGDIYRAQFERGIFDNHIVGIVSRTEAFIQECLVAVILEYPEKLSIISEGAGIPVDLFLEHQDRNVLLERYVASRCEGLMFGKPEEYLRKAAKVLSIEIKKETMDNYIEVKASRDIIVHNLGEINQLYLDKARKKRRGEVGDELIVDETYFREVILRVKSLADEIRRNVEKKFGPPPA